MKTVIAAMSGGVDSSVTALKLLEEGYEVIGLTLAMGRCCDESAIADAKGVADSLSIRHEVLDVSENFSRDVMDYFIDSYKNGETPNPCAKCNRLVKFDKIIDFMHNSGADYMATGHYAQIIKNDNSFELHKAIDLTRDQSYFLSTLKYDFLKYIKFPVGMMKKSQVRELATKKGLHVANKNDSQDVCFIERDYRNFLKNKTNTNNSGDIRYIDGTVLGKHDGIFNYTIGQRKGLNISYGEPLFVTKIDIKNNIVYVGKNENLFTSEVEIYNINILSEIQKNKEYTIKLRSAHLGQFGIFNYIDNNSAVIKLKDQARAVTKGQLCCIYDGNRVVASGWIK